MHRPLEVGIYMIDKKKWEILGFFCVGLMLRVKEMSTMLLVPKILNLLVLNNGTLTKRNKENVEVDIANICCINMG